MFVKLFLPLNANMTLILTTLHQNNPMKENQNITSVQEQMLFKKSVVTWWYYVSINNL